MKEEDTLSILEAIERGEKSIEEAEAELANALTKSKTEVTQPQTEKLAIVEPSEEIYIPTRPERMFAMAEKFGSQQSHIMIGPPTDDNTSRHWPWPDSNWQWMWQNLGYPAYINHSIDAEDGSELHIVLYHGNLSIQSWDKAKLQINGASFDLRMGQDENIIRIASGAGQLHFWIPENIIYVNVRMDPGDLWLSNVSADINAHCKSGDLGFKEIKGSIKALVNGGDARLVGVEGPINVNVIRGNADIRSISSTNVSLKAREGNIWLSLESVDRGRFQCESDRGDINLLTNGELSCELIMETTDGGMISPNILPWRRLLERTEGKLRGILMDGGAHVSLMARDGKIYIQ